jgi:uncharacterized protein (TIGR00251 family)
MKISIKVKPKSSRSEILKMNEEYIAYLKTSPEGGKGNLELLKLARKYFKKEVRIVKGFTSKNKVLEIISV